ILKMVKNDQALPYDRKFEKAQLPEEYLNNIKNVQVPPLLLVSGDKNKIFPGANKITHERLSHEFSLENTEYQEFKGYGHQDILMGKRCSNEVFPYFVKFLNEHKRS
ncbi:MAG: hypothetical protein KDD50_13800, partial [Bdellovibrionales bacterium]|nr:hypothetical protein [Bdellovibrionales bacterium]